jgi:hypothetical protein
MNYLQFWGSRMLFNLIVAGVIIGIAILVIIIILLRIKWVNRRRRAR